MSLLKYTTSQAMSQAMENTQVTVKLCTVFYLQHQKDYYKQVPPAQNQRNIYHRQHLDMLTAMKTEKIKA